MLKIKCNDNPFLYLNENKDGKGNYSFSFSSTLFEAFSNSLARDLVKIGQSIFLADRAFTRNRKLGNRTRDFHLYIRIENVEKWNSLSNSISILSNFVSHDNWHFYFSPSKSEKINHNHYQNEIFNTSVSLFSDGIDSFCGAAALLKSGINPIFTSHCPPSLKTAHQRILSLKNTLGLYDVKDEFANFSFLVSDIGKNGKRNMFQERSRRTRPLFFLSLAGAVAIECGISDIYLNENGPLAINLPFRQGSTGHQISRHAHPFVLNQFEEIINKLDIHDATFHVHNLFYNLTKGEELKLLSPHYDLAFDTLSCEYARQQISRLKSWNVDKNFFAKNVRECGLCSPCLIRRAAFHTCGINEPNGHYAYYSIRKTMKKKYTMDFPLYNIIANNPFYLYSFAKLIKDISFEDFCLKYSYDLSTIKYTKIAKENSELSLIYDLYKRFASQIINFLEDEVI